MASQPALFQHTRYEQLSSAFLAFDRENPRVWELFVRFTFQAIRAEHRHYGWMDILGRIRWHTTVETRGEDFKINNNHGPFYARKFHQFYPEHDGFFRLREQTTKGKVAR